MSGRCETWPVNTASLEMKNPSTSVTRQSGNDVINHGIYLPCTDSFSCNHRKHGQGTRGCLKPRTAQQLSNVSAGVSKASSMSRLHQVPRQHHTQRSAIVTTSTNQTQRLLRQPKAIPYLCCQPFRNHLARDPRRNPVARTRRLRYTSIYICYQITWNESLMVSLGFSCGIVGDLLTRVSQWFFVV